MRAVRNTDAGIQVLDVPEPSIDGVSIRVASSGICGSDLHMLGFGPMPFTLGHEVGGILDDGTPVAMWPSRPCGTCDRCQAGFPTQCRTGFTTVYGATGGDGGMADAVTVEQRCIVALPAGVAPGDACLVEPIACSVHALRGQVSAGDRVAVVGAGSIGLGAAAVARWCDATVDVVARHDHQARAAAAFGAGAAGDGEYDVVVDGAGTSGSVADCFRLLRPGGTVVFVSTAWEPVEFPMFFSSKEPTIVSGQTHEPRDMADAAQLLADLPEVAPALITHRLPLDRAADAFRIAADRKAGAIKVVLEP